jgi:hypothetical protein
MSKKIIYKKNDLLGDSVYHSKAMRDISQKDQEKEVINQYQEKKELFNALKEHRNGGVTEKELKSVLADLKYSKDDHFTEKEVNDLAQELGLGRIERKHMLSQKLPHPSRLDRARHVANFSNKSRNIKNTERMFSRDDLVQHSASNFLKEVLRERRRKNIVSGDLMFDKEEEDVLFRDMRTGKRISGRATQLTRPHINIKNQASFRGRGLIGGSKNF